MSSVQRGEENVQHQSTGTDRQFNMINPKETVLYYDAIVFQSP